MKPSTQKKIAIAFIPIATLLVYGLWPLGNPKYAISFDQQKIAFRKAFIQQQQPRLDSTPIPNIILILADDLSVMDVSAYGGEHVLTTNIDNIAKNGDFA